MHTPEELRHRARFAHRKRKTPCHVEQGVQRSHRPFDTNGPQRPPATLPRGCARTPVAGRSSGLGFVLRSSLPDYPEGEVSGVQLLRPPSQRRGRPGIAPEFPLSADPASRLGDQRLCLKSVGSTVACRHEYLHALIVCCETALLSILVCSHNPIRASQFLPT